MNSRVILAIAGLAALSACAPAVPDSGADAGVGFDTYEARAQREAALANPSYVPDTVLPPSGTEGSSAAATAAETRRVLESTRSGQTESAALNSGVEPLQASPSNPAPGLQGHAGISDENSFEAVAGRQTIESDAARIQANREQYQVVQPESLPTRSGNGGPNIVAYALQTSHPRGQTLYPRSGFNGQSKFERNCASYPSNDLAQIDFLEMGGPERDRKGLDPDGDGYACAWDPTPFRRASGG